MSGEAVKKFGVKPIAKFKAYVVAAAAQTRWAWARLRDTQA
jgi:hypothetical protein